MGKRPKRRAKKGRMREVGWERMAAIQALRSTEPYLSSSCIYNPIDSFSYSLINLARISSVVITKLYNPATIISTTWSTNECRVRRIKTGEGITGFFRDEVHGHGWGRDAPVV